MGPRPLIFEPNPNPNRYHTRPPPSLSQGVDDPSPPPRPLSEGLDPPLYMIRKKHLNSVELEL